MVEKNINNKNKKIIFTICIAFLLIVAIVIFVVYKTYYEPALTEIEFKNTIANLDYDGFVENAKKTNNANLVYDELINELNIIDEKIDSFTEDEFNQINDFYNQIISSESVYISEETLNTISDKLKHINYNFYIKNADKMAEDMDNRATAILYYNKAIYIFKDDKNNEELSNNAKQKYVSIIEKVNAELLNEVNNYINNNDYNGGYEYLLAHEKEYNKVNDAIRFEKYAYDGKKYNIDISFDENGHGELYNKATAIFLKVNEEKDQIKKETETVQQTKNDYKKDQLIVDTDGKQIYKVYMSGNTLKLKGNYSGSGNFIIELLDSNQDFYKLLVNEIGDFVVDKSVYLNNNSCYYIKIVWSRGSWNLEWTGTYGQ